MARAAKVEVQIAPWKNDAQFVYSITYDEGSIDAVVNSYPMHAKHGIPGHICQVTGYLGKKRMDRGTSLFDIFYLNEDQLRFLVDSGWTFSSHSHTHVPTGQKGIDLDLEVRLSKGELERATGAPVDIFTYWGNTSLKNQIIPIAKEAGYLGILSIDYPLNGPDLDVWDIGRGTIGRDMAGWVDNPNTAIYRHTKDAFPGHLKRQKTRGKWLVDLTHVVAERLPPRTPPSCWNRCITLEILDARLTEVREVWGEELWAAVPEEVVHYTLMRRSTTVKTSVVANDRAECFATVKNVPAGVTRREITFKAKTPWDRVEVEGFPDAKSKDGFVIWTAAVVHEHVRKFVLRGV